MLTRTSEPYQAKYAIGDAVRIVSREALVQFQSDWQNHHAVVNEQLELADRATTISQVSFYHMGTVLYELEGIPGWWHEPCLCLA